MERPPRNDNERPGWGGYVAAIVVSALGHIGVLAFALLVLPNWLHSETVEPPAMTVKIVDNIPAGDLGTHLPKLSGYKQPEPEQVAKAEVKPEEPPPPEAPPPPELPKPADDKNAVSLKNSPKDSPFTPTPTPEPLPDVIPATPEPTPTETPKKVAEPAPTAKPPPPKPHREKVIGHNPPKAKHTPVQMAKAEKTPDVEERFRKLKQEMLQKRLEEAREEAKKRADDDSSNDDDDSNAQPNSNADDNGEHGPVVGLGNTPGKGRGIGPGEGSMGRLEDLQYLLYFRTIQQRVKDAWTFPGGANDLSADVEFSISTDGTLNGVKIAKGSGDSAFDESVLRAIRRAAPFPPPPDRYRAQFSDVISSFKLGELKS